MSLPRRIVVASGNPGKLEEIRRLFPETGPELVSQSSLGVEPAEESAASFTDNALIKARHAARRTGLPAIADDSGLEVDALDGAPGVRSARYAGEDAADRENVDKLLGALEGVPEHARGARFVCVVAYVEHADDPEPVICKAEWKGRILEAPSGSGGFGYDPVFFVAAEGMSAAALSPERKNALSHRGQASRALIGALNTRYGSFC